MQIQIQLQIHRSGVIGIYDINVLTDHWFSMINGKDTIRLVSSPKRRHFNVMHKKHLAATSIQTDRNKVVGSVGTKMN